MTPRAAYGGTQVGVESSQGELRTLLRKFGADQFTFGEGADWVGVEFVHRDHLVRMRCPLRPFSTAERQPHKRMPDEGEWGEQEGRRIWRVIVWTVKARLVAVDEQLETFEAAFLSQIVNPATGTTVWEQLRESVEAGALRLGGAGLPELGRGR